MQKHKELLGEACELVIGLQELLEDFSDTVDCINYVTQDEGVAKAFRLAAALLYVETPNDFETVKNLKNNMKLQKIKVKKLK